MFTTINMARHTLTPAYCAVIQVEILLNTDISALLANNYKDSLLDEQCRRLTL